MTKKEQKELESVRAIVQEWLDKQGHERCWYYPELFNKLKDALNMKSQVDPALPTRQEFENGCKRFQIEEFGNEIQ